MEELIQRLSETDEALQALGAGELDAVVDPASAAPILLSHAQKALADSEARYRELVSRCPALVCEITPEGVTTFVNDAVRVLLGLGKDRATHGKPDDARTLFNEGLAINQTTREARMLTAELAKLK